MILQQRIPLYNFFIPITLALLVSTSLFFAISEKINIGFVAAILFATGVIFFIFRRIQLDIFFKHHSELDVMEGKVNMLKDSIEEKEKILKVLPCERQNLTSLFKASQNLIELMNQEDIFNFLIDVLGDLFPKADTILLFDFNKEKDNLSLIRSLKRKDSVVEEKRGGALDKWVLRHNSSLLVEDITKDYRFDHTAIRAYHDRKAQSFIVSPLSIEHRLLGIVRIESRRALIFSLDDLRLLRNICDLAVVVLERANLFNSAQNLAIKDSLTSLFVKDYFFKRLSQEYKRILSKKADLGIIMLDIDDFKKINDSHGHVVGDFILSRLAGILKKNAGGGGNVIARFGGEEFIILVVECGKEKVINIAEKIRKSVEEAGLLFRRERIDFTISAGVVFYPDDAEDMLGLVDKADKRLYKAKEKGKNRVCFSG